VRSSSVDPWIVELSQDEFLDAMLQYAQDESTRRHFLDTS